MPHVTCRPKSYLMMSEQAHTSFHVSEILCYVTHGVAYPTSRGYSWLTLSDFTIVADNRKIVAGLLPMSTIDS
jgi:hypothetical protein